MNPEDVKVLVRTRMAQADEALQDARFLFESQRGYRTVVSRSYYAAFYATLALPQTCGKAPRSHGGALALLATEFVRPGLMSDDAARRIRRLFDRRQNDDYRRLTPVSGEEAGLSLEDADAYIASVRDILSQFLC